MCISTKLWFGFLKQRSLCFFAEQLCETSPDLSDDTSIQLFFVQSKNSYVSDFLIFDFYASDLLFSAQSKNCYVSFLEKPASLERCFTENHLVPRFFWYLSARLLMKHSLNVIFTSFALLKTFTTGGKLIARDGRRSARLGSKNPQLALHITVCASDVLSAH